MKRFLLMLAMAFAVGLATVATEAEAAKRLGGGKSLGTQRQAAPDKSPAVASPAATSTAATGAGASAATSRSWMGPVAGLAAGLGLAALASHLGFGDELATMVMFGVLAAVVMAVIGFVMRKRALHSNAGSAPAGMQYAHASTGTQGRGHSSAQQVPAYQVAMPATSGGASAGAIGSALGMRRMPAGIDAQAFEHNAKVNFVRLQAAHDAGDLEVLRSFTTPELFAVLKCEFADYTCAAHPSEMLNLQAEVTDVEEASDHYVVTVRFTGQIRADNDDFPEVFDERWHLVKDRNGSSGWLLAGIQQSA